MDKKFPMTKKAWIGAAAGVCLLAAVILLLAGRTPPVVFDGSTTTDASGSRMEYRVLDREISARLDLTAGEELKVTLAHVSGTVDLTVGMEGREPIYRGNGQKDAGFTLRIPETGNYRVSVTGHQAKGSASFTRLAGGQE